MRVLPLCKIRLLHLKQHQNIFCSIVLYVCRTMCDSPGCTTLPVVQDYACNRANPSSHSTILLAITIFVEQQEFKEKVLAKKI